MFQWLWKLLYDQRGIEGESEAVEATGEAGTGENAEGAVDNGTGEGGQGGDAPVTTPKFGEFGDDPNEAAAKLFDVYGKTKTEFDNFKTKSGLTERNLGALRKTLEGSGVRAIEDPTSPTGIRLEVIKQPERKTRFTDDHAKIFDKPVLEGIRLLVQDLLDEQFESKDRMTKEQHQKMQQFLSEKNDVEELMSSYFPQLDGKFQDGKATNPQFNQAFYDRATQIWQEQYNSNPLKQLSAALRAAKELNIIPQMIQAAKKEGVEVGKKEKKILGPVNGTGSGAAGGMRKLSKTEYLALPSEDKLKYDQWEQQNRK